MAKYLDLAGLCEIVKLTKIVVDMAKNVTAVPLTPSISSKDNKMPTIMDFSQNKVYHSSYINTLGIRIFEYPITFRNHGTADAHIHEEHTKIKLALAQSVASLHGMVTASGLTSRSISELGKLAPHGCGYPVPWYDNFHV